MGMPLHCLPYDHGRLALDETPYPPSTKSLLMKYIFFFFYFTHNTFPQLIIRDGSTLLKSRDGGRSLNISIEKNMPLLLLHKNQRKL